MLRFETLTNEPSIIHLLLLILIRVGGGGGAYPSVIGHMGLELATVIGQELEYSLDKKIKIKNVSNSIFQLFCVNNSLNSL